MLMTYNVILTPKNGRFLAQVVELPDCKAEAGDRDKALALIQKRIEDIIKRIEIVQVKIPRLGKKSGKNARSEKRNGHSVKAAKSPNLVRVDPPIAADDKSVHLETPWEFIGIFKDDPTWWPMLEDIERRRDRHVVYPKKKRKKK